MAQHDYNIANADGATFRADINSALSAILSNNSGSTDPTTYVAGTSYWNTIYKTTYCYNGTSWIDTALASNLTNTPTGNIAATTVQGAINELDSKKVAKITSTANKLVKFSDTASTITNSVIYDDGTNVGIGTNSPSRLFTVYNLTAPFISIQGAADNDGGILFGDNVSDAVGQIRYNHTSDVMYFKTNATERMRIDSSGNVGIGTSSPSSPIHLYSSSPAIRLQDSDGGTSLITGYDGIVTIQADIQNGYANSAIKLYTDGSEKVTVDSSGNVGVGVVPSGWNSSFKAIDIGNFSIAPYTTISAELLRNAYAPSGTYLYRNNGYAERYVQASGIHQWLTAPSGTAGNAITWTTAMTLDASSNLTVTGSSLSVGATGYATGAGGTVTQATSRTTGVTINKVCGSITLVSAAGSATWQSFTVTNSTVAATDVVRVCQKSGTDSYQIHVTNISAGSFKVSFATTGGTTTEQPVFNFAVIKAVTA